MTTGYSRKSITRPIRVIGLQCHEKFKPFSIKKLHERINEMINISLFTLV